MREANALRLLFLNHYADVRALITAKFNRAPQDAEDIVQDAFHNILRAGNIDQLENPKAYLYKTASNLALNRLRKQGYDPHIIELEDIQDGQAIDAISPERQAIATQDLARLEDALQRLPEKYRRTFLLSRMQEKTYKEISEQLDIAESTVEKHIIKVLKCLREHLDKESA